MIERVLLVLLLSSPFVLGGEEEITKLSSCISLRASGLENLLGAFPDLLLRPRSSFDVQTIISCANLIESEGDVQVRVGVKGGGHSNEGYGIVERERVASIGKIIYVQIDLELLSEVVNFDQHQKTITVNAGMRLSDFHTNVLLASQNSLFSGIGLGGINDGVGGVSIGGYVLCGGFGLLGRTFGVSSDQVVEMLVVLPGGEKVRASKEKHEELFWALRGGCSSVFGVVVEVTIGLFELGDRGEVVVVDVPAVVGRKNVVLAMEWYENYAANVAPKELSSSSFLTKEGTWMSTFLYFGDLSEAKQATLEDLKHGFAGIFSEDVIENAYQERALSSLIPHPDSPEEKLKCSSSLLFSQIGQETLQALFDFSVKNKMDTHWLAFGEENGLVKGNGPLVRGQLFEVVFCVEEGDHNSKLREANHRFFESFKSSPNYISNSWGQKAGVAYFGEENLQKLFQIRNKYHKNTNVLVSEASRLLYPYTTPYVYVGTEAKSIFVFKMSENGELTLISGNPALLPSWLDFFPRRDALLASSESSDFDGTSFGGLYTFKTTSDGRLEYISSSPSYSRAPDHCHVSPDGTFAYAAHCCGNTTLFSVDSYYILGDESLQNATHSGVVTDPSDCDAGAQYIDAILPFLHEVVPHPTLPYTFVNDLNKDAMYTYFTRNGYFDPDTPTHTLQLGNHTGPRHLTFHPYLPYIFLASEKSSTVTVIYLNQSNGELSVVEIQTSLSQDQLDNPGFKAGEIGITSDGKYVYSSNRDTGIPDTHRSSIAVFTFNQNNSPGSMLKQIQNINSGGDHPRHFSITDDNSYLLCANQFTNNLVTFSLDQDTGFLTQLAATNSSLSFGPSYIRLVDILIE